MRAIRTEGAPCTGTERDQREGDDALGRCHGGGWLVIACVEVYGENESLCGGFVERANPGEFTRVERDVGRG